MNDLSDIGLLKREFRDVHSVVSRLDRQTRKLFEPSARPRPGGQVARLATVELLLRTQKRPRADVAKQLFGADRDLAHLIELKSAMAPAQTGVAGWAAELVAVAVQDVADNLLPQTALAQLRSQGLAYAFIDGAVARVPVHAPRPSGGFVLEAGAISVGALILSALNLKPKKAAGIVAITKELLQGSAPNIELSLQTLLAQDIGLTIDNILLGNAAASAAQPAGLLARITPLTPSVASTTIEKVMADIKALISAIYIAARRRRTKCATPAPNCSTISPRPRWCCRCPGSRGPSWTWWHRLRSTMPAAGATPCAGS